MMQCHRPQAIRALFKQVPYSVPKRIALIGGGCSVASEPTAEISQHFNMMQVRVLISKEGEIIIVMVVHLYQHSKYLAIESLRRMNTVYT